MFSPTVTYRQDDFYLQSESETVTRSKFFTRCLLNQAPNLIKIIIQNLFLQETINSSLKM